VAEANRVAVPAHKDAVEHFARLMKDGWEAARPQRRSDGRLPSGGLPTPPRSSARAPAGAKRKKAGPGDSRRGLASAAEFREFRTPLGPPVRLEVPGTLADKQPVAPAD